MLTMEEIKDRGRSSLMLSHHRKKERTNFWLFHSSRKQGCCSLLIYFIFPVQCRLEWFAQRCCSFCSKFVWTHLLMPCICCNLFFSTIVLENLRQLFLLTAFWLDSKSWRINLQGKTGASIRSHDNFLTALIPGPNRSFSCLFSAYILQWTREGPYPAKLNSHFQSSVI